MSKKEIMQQKLFIISVIVLIIAIGCAHGLRLIRGEVDVVEKNFNKMPYTIGAWKGEDNDFAQEIYNVLRADDNLSRIYTRDDGKRLGLYIGYYGTKRGGHPEHIPSGCYTGAGWGIESVTPLDVSAYDGSKTITINNFYAVKGNEGEQVLYWLQNFRGTVSHSGLRQNIEKMKTRLLYNRNDGAFIRINARVDLTSGETRDDVIAFQKNFISHLIPLLPKYWPVEEVRK